MLESSKASLVILGLNTTAPEVFWRGEKLNHVVRVRGNADSEDAEVTIRVNDPSNAQSGLYFQMSQAGIKIKQTGS